jgi:hypothetical protein
MSDRSASLKNVQYDTEGSSLFACEPFAVNRDNQILTRLWAIAEPLAVCSPPYRWAQRRRELGDQLVPHFAVHD